MSKDTEKAEPSMDDILASIRRIIDEDGTKTRKQAAPSSSKSGGGGADILELTEMVNEDGSLTSLEKAGAPPAAPKMMDDDEPPIYADRGERNDQPGGFVAPDLIRPTLAGDPRPQSNPPLQPERSAAPPPAQPPQQPQPQAQPQPARAAPPAQPPAAAASARVQPPPTAAGSQFSLTPVAPPSPQGGMVSGQTANAAASAFDRLAQAALQQQAAVQAPPAAPRAPSPTVGGRPLEDMVGEMLRPMLQQWLNANLPAIVERLVQQEIQKLSKR